MKSALALALVCLSLASTAHANIFEDATDSQELANALLQCGDPAKALMANRAYASDVVTKHQKVSANTDVKTYDVEIKRGGMAFGPPAVAVGAIRVMLIVTQPPVGQMDAPSMETYTCQVTVN